jgi:GMP synthase-like glutamine amidotransferase
MRIHSLQHVSFENLANIRKWAEKKGWPVSRTLLSAKESFPGLDDFDWLVIMGGPMNIYEETQHPWLAAEKSFITEAIKAGKVVLGICLGAQLIADVLGGKVTQNLHKEIGWYPVELTAAGEKSAVFASFPAQFPAFHWHGDTFAIPPGAVHLARSAACANQAFSYQERVIGLQFHLESSLEAIQLLSENCGDELEPGRYMQSAAEMASPSEVARMEKLMGFLLANLEKNFPGQP